MSHHKSVGALSAVCLSGSLVDGDFEQGVAGQQLPEVGFEKHLVLWRGQGCSELKTQRSD